MKRQIWFKEEEHGWRAYFAERPSMLGRGPTKAQALADLLRECISAFRVVLPGFEMSGVEVVE